MTEGYQQPWLPDHFGEWAWARRWHPPAGARPDPDLTVEDNPVIARFIGLDGHPVILLRERRTVPFGYQRPRP